MDQDTLVEGMIDEGRQLVRALEEGGLDILIGFWAHRTDVERWVLCVASRQLDEGAIAGPVALTQALRRRPFQHIGPADVRLVRSDSPVVAQALLEGGKAVPGESYRTPAFNLGPLSVDELYIYPAHAHASAEAPPRETRVFGRELVVVSGEEREQSVEVGTVPCWPSDDRFPEAFRRMVEGRFGTFDDFLRRFPRGVMLDYSPRMRRSA